jgi:1-deoxy-11beta-hydroxypentalenate dehydrogenase
MTSHEQNYTGKTAVVTGAAGGIGLAIATRLVKAGARVAIADVDGDALSEAYAGLQGQPGDVIAIPANLADAAAVEALASGVAESFGELDLLFANAGIAGPWSDAAWSIPIAEWRRVFDVNVFGLVNTLAAFVPSMLNNPDGGHIVVTTSLASFLATDSAAPYFASKHAAYAVVETLRLQLAQSEVGLSVLCPDRVRTRVIEREIIHTFGADAAAMAANVFAGEGVLEPDDVATIVLDGVFAKKFLLLTHDDSRRQIEERIASLQAELG